MKGKPSESMKWSLLQKFNLIEVHSLNRSKFGEKAVILLAYPFLIVESYVLIHMQSDHAFDESVLTRVHDVSLEQIE